MLEGERRGQARIGGGGRVGDVTGRAKNRIGDEWEMGGLGSDLA